MSHKEMGDLYRTLWLCEAGMLNSYRLYVPTGWKYEKKKKMLIYLHGAGGEENSGFERSHNRIQYLAEKRAIWCWRQTHWCTEVISGEQCLPPACLLNPDSLMAREIPSTIPRPI